MRVNVAVVGLDRLSTSFALALKRYQESPKAEHSFNIIGRDLRGQAMKEAAKLGALDNFNRKLQNAVAQADLVLVNVPPSQLRELYARLGGALKSGAVVLDMTPLKRAVLGWADEFFPRDAEGRPLAYVVGITPIVNVQGLYHGDREVQSARADLFQNAEVLIAADAACPAGAIALAEDVVRLVGAKPRFIDPVEHDGLIAATEGLPALTGVALFDTLRQSEGWPELRRMVNPALALTFQALRDYSAEDLIAFFSLSREDVLRHLDGLLGTLETLRDVLAEEAEDGEYLKLEAYLERVAQAWENWEVKRYSGEWEKGASAQTMAGPFGGLGRFLTLRRSDDNHDARS